MTLLRSCVVPGCPGRTELESDAYGCEDCQRRLVRQLGEIETYLSIMSPIPTRGAIGRHSPGFGSVPPLRLDVVAMLDPRTEINGDGPDDVVDEVPNVTADLGGWVRVLVEELEPDYPMGTWVEPATLATVLRTHVGWIVRQSWVDEFAADITRVHGALRRACGDAPPRTLGRCLDAACGGEVHRRSDDPRDPRLRCGRCSTSYDGLDLVRVRERAWRQ